MRKTETGKKVLTAVGCFALYMLMLLGILNRGPGFTDEADNFIGGMVIESGGSIYRDFASQHMPVMYYICALLKLLGADSIYSFRLSFYVILALLWTLVALNYGKKCGWLAAVGSGAFYIVNMFTQFTCCILAEQLQSVGFVILFLEFLQFTKTRKLELRNSVMISLAVFLSFGSAFVSAFTVFAMAMAFFYVGIEECVEQKSGFAGGIGKLFGKFWKTALWILAPFVVMLVIYGAKGTLDDFIYGAYTVNREIYPDYLNGYGSSALMGFVTPVINYFQTLKLSLQWLVTTVGFTKEYLAILRWNICFFINFLFWIYFALRDGVRGKKHIGEAATIAYFTIMCANRGVTADFHSLPYQAVTMAMAAWLLQSYIRHVRKKHIRKKPVYIIASTAIAGMLLVYSSNYLAACRSVRDTAKNLNYKASEDVNHVAYWIQKLTEEDEPVLLTTVEPQILVEADRVPYKTGVSVPWMYEAFEEEELSNLLEYAPRVAVYQPDYSVWEYPLREYAPEVWSFMEANYTTLDGEKFPTLYIRNDYLEEARGIYEE